MANSKRSVTSRLKRAFLNFDDDEKQIKKNKQQREQAFERLAKTSKGRTR